MSKQNRWIGPLILACSLGFAAAAVAQNQNPGNGGGGGQNFRNMTPEQRQQAMQQMREQAFERTIRRTLQTAGFTATTIQDPVVAYAKDQSQGEVSLQAVVRKLVEAVSTKGIADADISTLLGSFRDAVAKEVDRRKTAQAALDAQVNYSKTPRLEAVLTSLGLIGDESLVVGGLAGGANGFGGRRGQAAAGAGAAGQGGAAAPGAGAAPGGAGANAGAPLDFRIPTADQRQQLMDLMRDFNRQQTLLMALTNVGFTDKALQDTVLAFSNDQEKARQPLQAEQVKFRGVVTSLGNDDTDVTAALLDYRKAVDTEKTRRKTALADLDKAISYTTQPKLDAVLTVLGLSSDDMAIAGEAPGAGGLGGGGFGGGGFGGGGFGGGGGGRGGGGFGGGGGGGFGGGGGGFGGGGGNGGGGGRGRRRGGGGGGNGGGGNGGGGGAPGFGGGAAADPNA